MQCAALQSAINDMLGLEPAHTQSTSVSLFIVAPVAGRGVAGQKAFCPATHDVALLSPAFCSTMDVRSVLLLTKAWRGAIAQSAMATPLIVILYEQLAFMLRNSLNIVHS